MTTVQEQCTFCVEVLSPQNEIQKCLIKAVSLHYTTIKSPTNNLDMNYLDNFGSAATVHRNKNNRKIQTPLCVPFNNSDSACTTMC